MWPVLLLVALCVTQVCMIPKRKVHLSEMPACADMLLKGSQKVHEAEGHAHHQKIFQSYGRWQSAMRALLAIPSLQLHHGIFHH